ncbi:hypothetical protein AVL44_gp19 [Pseudomonas phage DL60]|uniref:Uncharacterized protein n=1 Tax=Pseudomonas phage DL60 TaxID=1640970 RepID=A0A0F6WDB4_9CAUD|nr:hypothetical protein AVL44_gp19 [Pseudomonas phage DL60]AKF13845.1 hypothetical protein [Pseudomonas phage DL60]
MTSSKWNIGRNDTIAVEAVNSREDFRWNGKIRIIHYSAGQIVNIIEFYHHDLDWAIKNFGIKLKAITKGREILHTSYFGEYVK